MKKVVFKNFAKFTGKHSCGVSFLIKLQASGFFAEHPPVAASVYYWNVSLKCFKIYSEKHDYLRVFSCCSASKR